MLGQGPVVVRYNNCFRVRRSSNYYSHATPSNGNPDGYGDSTSACDLYNLDREYRICGGA